MPNTGRAPAYAIPGILQGIGQGLYARQLKSRRDKEKKDPNVERHINYIMQKIDDPNTPPALKTAYEDDYFRLTGQRIYSPENPAMTDQDISTKKVFVPSYQKRTETGYEWVPPTYEKVPVEKSKAVITDPVTEYFNMLMMQKPGTLQEQELTKAKIGTEQAKAGAYRALRGQREKYVPPTRRDYTTTEQINAIKARLYGAKEELENYKSQFGGYIDDPRVGQLQQQIDSDMIRLDDLTGKQAIEEIEQFGERFDKAFNKFIELEKKTK